jgi:cytochrome c553
MKKIFFQQNNFLAVAFVTIFCLSACATAKLYVPTAAIAAKSGASLDILAQGHTLYMTKCGKCHEAPAMSTYATAEKTTKILNWMQPKAKITDDEKAIIRKYIDAKP